MNDRREPVNLTMQLHKYGSCVFLPKQQTIYASLSWSQVILVDLSKWSNKTSLFRFYASLIYSCQKV